MSVRAEWGKLREAYIHRPGIEMFLGLLEPYSFLYERFFSMNEAVFEHMGLEHTLTRSGVEVKRLKPSFVRVVEKDGVSRRNVIQHILRSVRYTGASAKDGREYLERVVSTMDGETLFNILLLNPSIETRMKKNEGADKRRIIYPYVTLQVPLANLYFLRDQQAATDIGLVYGRMAKPQRRREVLITKITFDGLGIPTAWTTRAPGTFEGGDFIPAGEFALVGLSDRTNRQGVDQLLRHGLGYDEVAVVSKPTHPLIPGGYDPMLYMHLDTYFNIPGEGLAVGAGTLIENTHVQVYVKVGKNKYRLDESVSGVTLSEYLNQKKFNLIKLSTFEQLAYAPNFLTLDDRKILAVDSERNIKTTLAKIQRLKALDPQRYAAFCDQAMYEYNRLKAARDLFPRKRELEEWGVDVIPLDLDALTGGYGAARCMVAAVKRG
ncbi:MAG: arginine deiminase family protein [Thermoprotei archaeon]